MQHQEQRLENDIINWGVAQTSLPLWRSKSLEINGLLTTHPHSSTSVSARNESRWSVSRNISSEVTPSQITRRLVSWSIQRNVKSSFPSFPICFRRFPNTISSKRLLYTLQKQKLKEREKWSKQADSFLITDAPLCWLYWFTARAHFQPNQVSMGLRPLASHDALTRLPGNS